MSVNAFSALLGLPARVGSKVASVMNETPGQAASQAASWVSNARNAFVQTFSDNYSWTGSTPTVPGATPPAAPVARTPAPAPAPQPAAPAAATYTVQPGDSLSAIAQRVLGDANRWQEIYALNTDQISNPNLIFPGQVLKLPGASAAAPAAPATAPVAPAPTGPANPNLPMAQGGGILFPAAFHPLQQSPEFGAGTPEQCAEWVHRAFQQSGHPLPWAGNGNQYWSNAIGQPGYARIANASGQLPKPGDILCFSGGAYGHVAIVDRVYVDPQNPANSWVEVAQANFSDGKGNPNRPGNPYLSAKLPLNPSTGAVKSIDPHLSVQGFVRPDAAHSLLPANQQAALASQGVATNMGAFA